MDGIERLRRALEQTVGELGEGHPQAAQCHATLGNALAEGGRLDDSRSHFEEALRIRRQALGDDHVRTAESLFLLAQMLTASGRHAQARDGVEQALAILRRVLPAEHPLLADSLSLMSTVLQSLDQPAAARPHAEQALAIRRRVFGEAHPYTAASLNDVGVVLLRLGEQDAARSCLERAVALRRDLLGDEHTDTAQSLSNLAGVDLELEPRRALPHLEESLAIRRKILPPAHPSLALSLINLGLALARCGDRAAGVPYLEEALDIRRRSLGSEHAATVKTLKDLASTLRGLGRLAAARPLFEELVAIDKRTRGADHPATAADLEHLGDLLAALGDRAAATAAWTETLAIHRRALGPDHARTRAALERVLRLAPPAGAGRRREDGGDLPAQIAELNRAVVRLLGQRRLAEAETLATQACELAREHLGEASETYSDSLANLAAVHFQKGELSPAEPLLRLAVEIARKTLGEDHPELAPKLHNLASLLQRQGDLAAAESLCRQALEIKRHSVGDQHPSYANSLLTLAHLCLDLDNYDEAERLYREALDIWRTARDGPHPDQVLGLRSLASVLVRRGDLDAAEELYRQALDVVERLGGDDRQVATSLVDLGTAAAAGGDRGAAEALYRRALARLEAAGEDGEGRARVSYALGTLELQGGEAAAAEPWLRRAAEIYRRLPESDRGDLLAVLRRLRQAYDTLGEGERAAAVEREIESRAASRRGAGPPGVPSLLRSASSDLMQVVKAFVEGAYDVCVDRGTSRFLASPDPFLAQILLISLMRMECRLEADVLAARVLGSEELGDWDRALLELTLGRRPAADVLALAGDRRQRCQAAYYHGAWLVTRGRVEEARTAFASCLELGADCPERALAVATRDRTVAAAVRPLPPRTRCHYRILGFELLFRQGRYRQALQVAREAQALAQEHLAPDDELSGLSLHNLVVACQHTGHLGQAEAFARELLELRRETLGETHREVATTLDNLAMLLLEKGEVDEAERRCRQAADIYRQLFGDEHPDYVIARNNLAAILHRRGDLEAAERLALETLEIRRRVRGDEHPETATSLHNLGVLYLEQGDLERAADHLRQAVAARRVALGVEHPEYRQALYHLAQVHIAADRPGEAVALLRERLELEEKALGGDHPEVASSADDLGQLYRRLGEPARAEHWLERAVEIRRRVRGEVHPETCASLHHLASLYRDAGRPEAAALRRRAFEIGGRLLQHDASAAGRCIAAFYHHDYVTSGQLAMSLLASSRSYLAIHIVVLSLQRTGQEEAAQELISRINAEVDGGIDVDLAKLSWPDLLVQLTFGRVSPEVVLARADGERARVQAHFYAGARLAAQRRSEAAGVEYDAAMEADPECLEALLAFSARRALVLPGSAEAPRASVEERFSRLCKQSAAALGEDRFEPARKSAEEALELARESFDEGDPRHATALNNLALVFDRTQCHDRAEALYRQSLEVTVAAEGEESSGYAITLNNLAGVLHRGQRWASAEETYRRALELKRRLAGEDSWSYATSLSGLAATLRAQGRPAEAEPLLLQAAEIDRREFGEDHPDYAETTRNLALYYQAIDADEEAAKWFRRTAQIYRGAFGEVDPGYIENVEDLALHAVAHQRFEEAAELCQEVVEIQRRHLGSGHPRYAASLRKLATVYRTRGDYRQAEALYQRVLAILDAAGAAGESLQGQCLHDLGALHLAMEQAHLAEEPLLRAVELARSAAESPEVLAARLNSLGLLLSSLGRYRQAGRRHQEALDIHRRLLPQQVAGYAACVLSLADWHMSGGGYAAAEELLGDAVARTRSSLSEESLIHGHCMARLGLLHQLIRSHDQAEAELHRAADILRRGAGAESPIFGRAVVHLASFYFSLGRYRAALPLARRAVEILAGNPRAPRPLRAQSLTILAVVCRAVDLPDEAQRLFQRALEIQRAVYGEEHPAFASSLSHLADLHRGRGRLAVAEPLFRRVLAIERAALGEGHPNLTGSLLDVAGICAATRRHAEALALMQEAIAIEDRLVGEVFSFTSEAQRMDYLFGIQSTVNAFLSLVWGSRAERRATEEAFELILRRKALGAEALAIQRQAVVETGGELEEKLRQLGELRMRIAQATLSGPPSGQRQAHDQQLRAWSLTRQALETELAREIPEMDLRRRLADVGRRAVVEALPSGTALVEFLRFDPRDFAAGARLPARYLAFVLQAGDRDSVRMVDLGEASEIDRLITEVRGELTGRSRARTGPAAGARLRQAVFDPLLPVLAGRRRLLLAPDGDLARLPFEVLPQGRGEYLIDRYEISYLATARDLLRLTAAVPVPGGEPVVVAAPDFDCGDASGDDPPAAGPGLSTSTAQPFAELPGTREEGCRVADLLARHCGIEVRPWLGAAALERPLKEVRSPWILHLATHGFFLPDVPSAAGPWPAEGALRGLGRAGGSDGMTAARLLVPPRVNPLLRSGLALAGANWKAGGFVPPPAAEDGILTAEDVTGLRLEGTQMVVLSACKTGLGEHRVGEGVFGLRRSFVLAGARTLVISLWNVPDEATRELMERFYRRVLAGEPRAVALRRSQLEIKQRHPHPFFWGAFICQGEPGPLPDPPAEWIEQPRPWQDPDVSSGKTPTDICPEGATE